MKKVTENVNAALDRRNSSVRAKRVYISVPNGMPGTYHVLARTTHGTFSGYLDGVGPQNVLTPDRIASLIMREAALQEIMEALQNHGGTMTLREFAEQHGLELPPHLDPDVVLDLPTRTITDSIHDSYN